MSDQSENPTPPLDPMSELLASELRSLRESWFLCVAFGVTLLLLGGLSITFAFVFGLAFVMLFGFLALAAGIVQLLSAFWMRSWSSFLMELLVGITYVIIGGAILKFPDKALEVLTIVLGCLILAVGIFRTSAAASLRFHNWGWSLFSGVLGILLGLIILGTFPLSSEWVIGVFIGVELLFSGIVWTTLGFASRSIPDPQSK